MVSQCLAREFPPLKWSLLNFYERPLGLSLCDSNLTQSKMDKSSPRIQVQSFLQGGLGFIVSARRVQHVSQAEMRGLSEKQIPRFIRNVNSYRLCIESLEWTLVLCKQGSPVRSRSRPPT